MSTLSSESRKYELKARAESQRETRDRIARVAAELHEEKGVAQTSVSEIARRAGVTRVTPARRAISETVVCATPFSSCSSAATRAIRSRVSRWLSARAFNSYLRLSLDRVLIDPYGSTQFG